MKHVQVLLWLYMVDDTFWLVNKCKYSYILRTNSLNRIYKAERDWTCISGPCPAADKPAITQMKIRRRQVGPFSRGIPKLPQNLISEPLNQKHRVKPVKVATYILLQTGLFTQNVCKMTYYSGATTK